MVLLTSGNRLSTSGIKEVAAILGGGIYADSLIFAEGEAQTGKSVFAQQFAYDAAATLNGKIVYYTTQLSVRGLLRQMKSISCNMLDYFLTDRFQIYPIASSKKRLDNRLQLQRLLRHIYFLPEQFNMVIVDSLTPLIRHDTQKTKIDFLHHCKAMCRDGRSIIITANPYVIDEQLAPRLFSLVDYYFKFRTEEAVMDQEKQDRQIFKILEVAKAHGAERDYTNRIRFEVLPGSGIHIVPLQDLRV